MGLGRYLGQFLDHGWSDRWSWRSAGFCACFAFPLSGSGYHGGFWLYGPGGFCDGPGDALDGLHGKSFLPMIVGFGCTVPAVYATRTLENEKDRKLTAFLATFMSCGARLPVYVVFGAAFFGAASGTPGICDVLTRDCYCPDHRLCDEKYCL